MSIPDMPARPAETDGFRPRLPVALLLLFLSAVAGERLHAQPLDSLIRRALESHPGVEAARLAIRRADARARSASAWEAPEVGVQFDMLDPSDPNPFGNGETMLMVEQMIPLFGQNRAMRGAMEIGAEVESAGLANVRRNLAARVEREYYTLWLIDRRAALSLESTRLAELIYKAAESRYLTGNALQSELLGMQLEIDRLLLERNDLAGEREEALARLNALLVRPAGTPMEPAPELPEEAIPSYDSLAALLPGNPELRRMEAMAKMSNAEADAELSMLKPMLMLRGGLTYMPEGHPLREANVSGHELNVHGEVMRYGLGFGAMLSIPFAPWSRSGPEERAEALRLEALGSLSERDAMRLEMEGMLGAAHAGARRAARKLAFYRTTQLPLIERTLDALMADYGTGRTSFSSVVDAYRTLIHTRMDLYMQQMEHAMSLSMMRESVGTYGRME